VKKKERKGLRPFHRTQHIYPQTLKHNTSANTQKHNRPMFGAAVKDNGNR